MAPLVLLLTACGEPTPRYYEDVKPILDARCVGCHQEGGIGPFALDSYDQAVTWSGAVAAAVESGTMPPWGASDAQTYVNDRSLTPEQIDTVVRWAFEGVPEGHAEDEGASLEVALPELERVDGVLEMPEAYQPSPAEATDDYRCFILDWTEDETTYVTGFRPQPGNDEVVHHIAAYLFRPDSLAGDGIFDTLQAWDDADEGPGYTCFGGPGGSSDVQVPVQQLAQWVPGTGAVVLPEGTGIEVPAGSKVVLQLHYYVAPGSEGETDLTTIDLQLADTVERRGAFAFWLDGRWPMGEMKLPAGQRTTHDIVGDPRDFVSLMTGELDLSGGFDIHTALLHMHTLGDSASLWVDKADGSRVPVLEIPAYDFDWQLTYELAEPVRFDNGDELGVSCTWDNTRGVDVTWGEGTDDEMCAANLYISEL